MITRILVLLFTAAMLLLAAFSTGSAAMLLLGILALGVLAYGGLSAWLYMRSLSLTASLDKDRIRRGDTALLSITVRSASPLPVAPVELRMSSTDGSEAAPLLLSRYKRQQQLQLELYADHVGMLSPGVEQVQVSDIFGLFTLKRACRDALCTLLVLPRTFDTTDLTYAPGDSGFEAMARATEDISDPADVRGYQPGDPIKKIHWKLSLRKGDLMVRRFEEPVLAEALVLPDCSPPPDWGHPEVGADIRDTLLETTLSVAAHEMRAGHSVRMPLLGRHPWEFESSVGLLPLEENLARLDFSETDRFERVLLLETRRMRKVGATAVIAARLNSAMIDMMIRMRRMGPNVCFFLVTYNPDDPRIGPLVSKLRQGNVEVRIVEPSAE